jgi:enamine deaminase RidA (YjgF/YER057c/UK114 family)
MLFMSNGVQYLSPEGLFKSLAFSQVVVTEGKGKTIYVGGQNSVDETAQLVGKGDLTEQTRQVMKNIITALKAAGAEMQHVVKLSINVLAGQDIQQGFEASQEFMKDVSHPPAITVLIVAGLGHPDHLLEMDAVAFVPDSN